MYNRRILLCVVYSRTRFRNAAAPSEFNFTRFAQRGIELTTHKRAGLIDNYDFRLHWGLQRTRVSARFQKKKIIYIYTGCNPFAQ